MNKKTSAECGGASVQEANLYEREKGYTVIKRNGAIVPFRFERILNALTKAFRDTRKIIEPNPLPVELEQQIDKVARDSAEKALHRSDRGEALTVEGIQDIVEETLIESGFEDIEKDYRLFREERKREREDSLLNLKVIRRPSEPKVRFNPMKIALGFRRAFTDSLELEKMTQELMVSVINQLTDTLCQRVSALTKSGVEIDIEMISDMMEEELGKAGYFNEAKAFILHREKKREKLSVKGAYHLSKEGEEVLKKRIIFALGNLKTISPEAFFEEAKTNFYEGITAEEVDLALIMTAKAKIEKDPGYSDLASRLLLDGIYRETMGVSASSSNIKTLHQNYFAEFFKKAVQIKRLNPELLAFDLNRLSSALVLERDLKFGFLGLQPLYDRYLIKHQGKRLETPQIFWMRVAMGLSLNEGEKKEEKAIEFYHLLSQFLFVSSTPTLFNSGTLHSQLSSCYLTTISDDLNHIFKSISDDARLSKWAGGIGNDWTQVRATGAYIQGTNGKSQGIIPFLKVANDTAIAVNQGGLRKGAICAYLECWHLDVEEFLELRKNTGDERRRTHDMNTANWICDLFIKRVLEKGFWTLFSPDDTRDLHDLYGKAFEKRYQEYEAMAERGEIKLFKKMEAEALWRKMLGMLYETGHPWLTFKDPSNIRSPQDHVGVIHSSNLCTEILLNTSPEETAVCNLGSINLAEHMTKEGIDEKKLAATIKTAIRMLDNVIDINYYPTPEAKAANLRHRPIGLGLMGFQDALYQLGISYASHEAVEFADESMELISYWAILSSAELAKERGPYSTFKGSKWDRGLLPLDTIALLEEERGYEHVEMDRSSRLDWSPVRAKIKEYGMRNSNTMAIAPTATIANITGVVQSIEPTYKHLYVKSNISGDFTVLNPYLVKKLKELELYDDQMIDDLKYFDGSLSEISRIPDELKRLFLTAFEIEPEWLIECASRRQKWIDMGQSLNLYLSAPSGKKLNDMYLLAWKKGLKTTYYLRALAATHVEKSTTDINARGIQPRWMKNLSPSSRVSVVREPKSCNLDGSCEACQ